ncbi:MAG: peptidoglycan-binding protein [Mesorhizobium sp.]|nr:peptidoglycan-binding protein [Mesorhizobium sp.]
MNSKRSYLDSLNAGRERRPLTAIDDLNRTLDTLGARLERPAPLADPRPAFRSEDRSRIERPVARDAYQDDLLAREMRQRAGATRHDTAGSAVQELAQRIESARRQEESAVSIAKIAADLKTMREELRQQMTAGLHREFEALRNDIGRAYATAAGGTQGVELSQELQRLSDSIHSLAQRSDDRGVDLLRRELDEVKAAVDHLAREETVLAVDRRWDNFDRRFDAFEERFTPEARMAADPAVEALNIRLVQIADAVNSLPESLSLKTLEDKVRTLAVAVDHFSRQQDVASPDSFALIEERLDEISRAIVASSLSVQSQSSQVEQFERIEARIASLARQIEELADDRPTGEVIDRINVLSQRVDEMARRAEFPEQAVERLGNQIALIASKLDSGFSAPDTDQVVSGLERRFASLTDILEKQQDDAMHRGQVIFRDLESRLDELTARLEQPAYDPASANSAIMSAIDARFDELAQRFGQSAAAPAGEAILGLESRLEEISSRLEQSTRQVAGIDPALIRSLEAQVAGLSAHLAKPGAPLPDFEDMGPRLEQIEQSIAGSRETILESARLVAEETIRSIAGSKSESPAVAALAIDLKALDALARRSDERNTRTFEAIHDTLLKIVDRLGTLETGSGEPRYAPSGVVGARTVLDSADMPPLEPHDESDPLDDYQPEPRVMPNVKRSPAEAAAAAASAAISDMKASEGEFGGTPKRSMLGGLARALTGKRDTPRSQSIANEDPAPELSAPAVDIDEPLDPKIANRPLEPGSGAPDLNAIMKRVRDERGQPMKSGDADTAKSDFIAAARRAAQAAAAEAETRKKGFDKVGVTGASGIGRIFRKHRKAALMTVAGVMIALAGLQLGRAFLAEDTLITTANPPESETQSVLEEAENEAPTEADATPAEDAVRMIAPSDETVAMAATGAQSAEASTGSLPEEIEQPSAPIAEASVPAPARVASEPTEAMTPIMVPVEAGPVPLREAAEAGDAKAMFEIGSRYAEGRGTKANLAEAAKWYERAANAGFAPAQYRIGNYYEKGTGLERDVTKAKTWYQMAAEQGNASAMHNLAVLYAMGADGTTDNESAGRWFVRAAELGVKDSQFNLGILSAKGVGVPQSLEESYKWFALVAKTGDKDAASKRDEVANALRPEQLQKARAATELWRPKAVVAEANDVTVPESWTESDAKTASVDMKQAIRNIQIILNKNGYDAGGADGVIGGKTKTAIAAFQQANGMEPTGEVTEELVRKLLEKK